MTFPSIIYKNFKYNFKKYMSFYFVNSLIVTMLFMYGSLMNNKQVIDSIGESNISQTIKIAFCGLVVFSLIFITYTNISFLKHRGKEFGTLLTLGVTRKDLGKIIFLENILIMTGSIVTGLVGGSLFSKLFYMGLNKVLETTNIEFVFDIKSFLLSIIVFALIFLSNTLFNLFYIRKVEIVDVIKSNKKGESQKIGIILGTISLILIIIALILLPKMALGEIFDGNTTLLVFFVLVLMIGPYFLIASIISLVKIILKKFPKAYNKNIIVLSNLTHKLYGYKNIIYLVSLLMAGAMFFVGLTYSLYATTKDTIEATSPYDIMFVESNRYNKVEEGEIRELLNGEKLETYKTFEYMLGVEFNEAEENLITFRNSEQMLISQDEYNKIMDENITVKKGEAIQATSYNEKLEYKYPDAMIAPLTDKNIEDIREYIEEDYKIQKENLNKIIKDVKTLEVKNINTLKGKVMANQIDHIFVEALILNNEDYKSLKAAMPENKIEIAHLINSKNESTVYEKLLTYLKNENNLDDSFWKSSIGVLYGKYPEGERGEIERKMPIQTEDLIKMSLESNGMTFFTMSFIGILFLISIGVILYYKILISIDEEKERIEGLKRIGVLDKEIKSIITKELAVIFLMPIVIGMSLGIYAIRTILLNSEIYNEILIESFKVCIVGILIQIGFYIVSRNKFINEVM